MMRRARPIAVVAAITVREAVRSRLLLVSLFFAVALVAISVAAASVSLGDRGRLIIDVGLAAASALGGGVAIAVGISAFAGELSRRTAYPLLVRPISRWGFVLGKHLGVSAAMICVVSGMLGATAVIVWMFGGRLNGAFWASMWLLWLEMLVVTAIAVMFSTLATPVLAASYAVGLWLAGNLADDVLLLIQQGAFGPEHPLSRLLVVFYYLLPDLGAFSLRAQAANDLPVPAGTLTSATAYAIAYAVVLLTIAMTSFSRRKII